MKTIKEAEFAIIDAEYCDGCDQVSDWTGTCRGTDQ